MKRVVVILASFILFISSLFAGAADFFDHRIFEVKLNVPANISNNTLTIADFLQEQVIIDLKKLYNDMPKKGFDATVDVMPSAAITLDFKKGLHFGVSAGVDLFANTGISKDLFRFIAKGNELNESFKVSVDGYGNQLFHYYTSNSRCLAATWLLVRYLTRNVVSPSRSCTL